MIYLSNLAKGVFCVAGGFLIQFSLGTIYTFGNMSPYMVSYLRTRTDDHWVNSGHMVWIFSLAVFSQALTMSLGGLLSHKIGARITCLIGCWTMSLGTLLTYFAIKQNLWCVIITYGLIFGVGTGLSYSVALEATVKWFPQRKGLVAGTVVAGYGLGSLIFNLVQTKFINPLNISPNGTTIAERYFTDDRVLDNVPLCFVIIGVSYALIQLLGVILLTDESTRAAGSGEVSAPIVSSINGVARPGLDKLLVTSDGNTEEEYSKNRAYVGTANEHSADEVHEFSAKEAVKDRRFWILWTTFFFNGIVIVAISSLYKSFGQTFISNDRYFSTVGAVSAIFNSGGRIIWGRLMDVVSYRKMMTGLTLLMTVVMGSFYACSYVSSRTGAEAMYFIWVCLLFFCIAGNFAMFPTISSQIFGSANMAVIYGLIFSGYAVSSIAGALIFSLLLKIIHYGGLFIVSTICALISLLLTQFFPKSPVVKPPKAED